MVGTEHSIVGQVYAAKTDPEAADALIGQYMGFIRSETVKFVHAAPEDGHEDELSIAMLAFYEAVLGYEKSRGAFLPFAARAIRNRLIDHYRTERRHRDVLSLHAPGGGAEDSALMDTLPDARDEIAETGKLPMNELALGSGAERKTLERHRKYLVAILLAFTNGYEIIRGHLCQIGSERGGTRG